MLGDDGKVNNEQTREVLRKFITAYAAWVEKNGPQ
jgi:chromate reductase